MMGINNHVISKRYKLFLFPFIACVLFPSVALGQDYRYRVEVLVLSHLDNSSEPREFHRLDNYSDAIDYLTPPPPEEAADTDAAQEREAPELPENAAALDAEPAEEELPRVIHIEEMSELMKENWRRLRLSAPFRPQQYLSWEQAGDEPFPALRMHNLEVVLVEDPWAEERLLLEEQALEAHEGGLASGPDATEDALGEAGEDENEDGLPDPYVYYQLDGTITLRRSRFLHLDVRLDWREPMYEDSMANNGAPTAASATSLLPSYPSETEAPPVPSAFLVHRLEQSRLVRTGRLEYFDHPMLGLLAYITRFEVEESDSPAN
jgi:hypothetical protein